MTEAKLVVLVVADNFHTVEDLRENLNATGVWDSELIVCTNPATGCAELAYRDVDVMFVDCEPGEPARLEAIAKVSALGKPIPIIALTTPGDEALAVEAVKAGATAYLNRERVTPDELQNVIVDAIQDLRLRRKAEEQKAELEPDLVTDKLTGLWTQRHFLDQLGREMARARRNASPLCVLMLEIDNLKQLAERHGAAATDLALSTVAKILLRYARSTDIIGRQDAQTLAIAARGSDLKRALVLAARARERIALQIISMGEHMIRLTCSVGLAESTPEMARAGDLLERAAEALRQAQAAGGNQTIPPAPGDAAVGRP